VPERDRAEQLVSHIEPLRLFHGDALEGARPAVLDAQKRFPN
jgi:hypothetical protein